MVWKNFDHQKEALERLYISMTLPPPEHLTLLQLCELNVGTLNAVSRSYMSYMIFSMDTNGKIIDLAKNFPLEEK